MIFLSTIAIMFSIPIACILALIAHGYYLKHNQRYYCNKCNEFLNKDDIIIWDEDHVFYTNSQTICKKCQSVNSICTAGEAIEKICKTKTNKEN